MYLKLIHKLYTILALIYVFTFLRCFWWGPRFFYKLLLRIGEQFIPIVTTATAFCRLSTNFSEVILKVFLLSRRDWSSFSYPTIPMAMWFGLAHIFSGSFLFKTFFLHYAYTGNMHPFPKCLCCIEPLRENLVLSY